MSPFANESLLQTLAETPRNPAIFCEKERKQLRAATWRSLFDLKESLKCGEITRKELEVFLDNLLIEDIIIPKKPKSRRERFQEKIASDNKDAVFATNLNLDVMQKDCENLPVIDADMDIATSLEKIIRPIISKEHRTDFVVVDGKTNIPLGIVSLRMLADAKDDATMIGNLPLAAQGITLSLSNMKQDALALMEEHNVSTLPVVDDKTGTLFAVLDRGTETQKGVRSGLVLLSTKWALHTLIAKESETQETV